MSPFTLPVLGPLAWIDVVLLVWFALTVLSVAYVAWFLHLEAQRRLKKHNLP